MSGVLFKHATASAHLFTRMSDQWRIGLIDHPRLGVLMPPGGHVEPDETAAEAVLRETWEETGIRRVSLRDPVTPALPSDFPTSRTPMPMPWWIVEESVPPDSRTDAAHVHIDHHFVLVTDSPGVTGGSGEHRLSWLTFDQVRLLPADAIFPDFRCLVRALFLDGSWMP
jgi:8-oxo-dGTP pyrophosphatase MutT (NUDIX family)